MPRRPSPESRSPPILPEDAPPPRSARQPIPVRPGWQVESRSSNEARDSLTCQEEIDDFEEVPSTATTPKCCAVINCGDPLDALDTNKSHSMVVAAGSRGVLKVYRIHEEWLELVGDLRQIKNRRLNLLYSPSNVSWAKHTEKLIGTTSTNGSIVMWDLEKLKLETHFKAHTRSATAIEFHPTEKHSVISGSKDALVYLYDIRIREAVLRFGSGGYDTIRDLKFCINADQKYLFSSCDDSGTVRIWDMRRNDKPYVMFPAHQGYCSSVSFGPGSRHLVATGGGRDKLIKVWDWSSSPECLYTVETQAPVARVYWRPVGNCSQIASCSVVNDMNIHVWDIRRPYLPYASFGEHRDSVTALAFDPSAEHRFISSGKDGLLILHQFKDAHYPMNYANDICIDTAPDGMIALAVNSLSADKKPLTERISVDRKYSAPKKQKPPIFDPFRGPTQSILRCGQPAHAAKHLTERLFCELALEYRLGGATPPQLAGFNSGIADKHGLTDVGRTWRMVCTLLQREMQHVGYPPHWREGAEERENARRKELARQYEEEGDFIQRCVLPDSKGPVVAVDEEDVQTDFILTKYDPGFRDDVLEIAGRRRAEVADRRRQRSSHEGYYNNRLPPLENLQLGEEKETDDYKLQRAMATEVYPIVPDDKKPVKRTGVIPMLLKDNPEDFGVFGEYHFGDEPTDIRRKTEGDSAWYERSDRGFSAWRPLPDEAFDPTGRDEWLKEEKGEKEEKMLRSATGETAGVKVEELLQRHADKNDVQTCACIALVFGRILSDIVGNKLVLAWIFSYENMLSRLQLYPVIAEMRKYCELPQIYEKSLAGTHMKMACIPCGKVIENGSCPKCAAAVNNTLCSVCRRLVAGLGWSCGACNHAYHASHARQWFRRFIQCPVVDCDCQCAYWDDPSAQNVLLRPRNLKQAPERTDQSKFTVEKLLYGKELEGARREMERQRMRRVRLSRGCYRPGDHSGTLARRWTYLCRLRYHRIRPISLKTLPDLPESSEEELFYMDRESRMTKRFFRKDGIMEEGPRQTRKKRKKARRECLLPKPIEIQEHEEMERQRQMMFKARNEDIKQARMEKRAVAWKEFREKKKELAKRLDRERKIVNDQGGKLKDEKINREDRQLRRSLKWKRMSFPTKYKQMCRKLKWERATKAGMNRNWGARPTRLRYVSSGAAVTPHRQRRRQEPWSATLEKFTLGRMAEMFEWSSINWQRELGCRRLVPRAFYSNLAFHRNDEELAEMPFEELQEVADDLEKVLRLLFATRKKVPCLGRQHFFGTGWRKRGRGRSGCAYPMNRGLTGVKRKGMRTIYPLHIALVLPTRHRIIWDPVSADRMTFAWEGRKKKEPESNCLGPLEHHHGDWMFLTPRQRLERMRKRIESRRAYMAHSNREHIKKTYDKWDRIRQEKFKFHDGREPMIPHWPLPSKEEREREKEKQEKELEDELKLLEQQRDDGAGNGRKLFSYDELFDEQLKKRAAQTQLIMDSYRRIEKQNKAFEEKTKKQKEKEAKEFEFKQATREYWQRVQSKKEMTGRDSYSGSIQAATERKRLRYNETKERMRRDHNTRDRMRRDLHRRMIAKSMEDLVDLQSITLPL